jgi:ferredoxin
MTQAYYFSPTGTTQTIVETIATTIDNDAKFHNITKPENRTSIPEFTPDDLIIFGMPVYAGRVPNVLKTYLGKIVGGGARGVAIVVYGNRHYDDALIELTDILTSCGITVVAAAAFIGQHSFSEILAKGRPDQSDLVIAKAFAEKFKSTNPKTPVTPPGNRPYRSYYRPKDEHGEPVNFKDIRPVKSDDCIQCGLCETLCPVEGICIKCCACVKQCPVGARIFTDPQFIAHKNELEEQFLLRKEPEFWIAGHTDEK